jgi:N-formylglutamate amidohydrolase
MPSSGRPGERDSPAERVDVVLGDCYASSCAASVVDAVEAELRNLGFVVTRNLPYSGGFVTQHYGRPAEGVHAIQIEINRALYMDEAAIRPGPGFAEVARRMTSLIGALGSMDGALLAA